MRTLSCEEVDFALDENDEDEEGFIPIESSIKEFSHMGVSTCCGKEKNYCFDDLFDCGFGDRVIRGWYNEETKEVAGMVHIEAVENDGELISELASFSGGSLRFNGKSMWEGFMEFEIE